MSAQNFNSKILSEFPNLPQNTTALHLNNVTINSAKLKVIPESIGNLTAITVIDARQNEITILPNDFFNLVNIVHLYLSNNKLLELPERVSNLKKLNRLHLDSNQLTKLPKEIGDLSSLQILILSNNPLEYLPTEISKLSNLTNLNLDNTGLPLPPNYSHSTPANTIKYVLENQKIPEPEIEISASKAFVFKNTSLPIVNERFNDILSTYEKEINVEFKELNSKEEITKDLNLAFFVITFDIHIDNTLVFSLIDECIKKQTTYFILYQKDIIEKDTAYFNMINGELISKTRAELQVRYSDKIKEFSSYDEFRNIITSALKQHRPKVLFNKITLKNIGHFSDLELNFDKKITCLVGENGSGKSTILKSIALATVGHNHKSINQSELKNLLKIQSLNSDGSISFEEGSIKLHYSIDGDEETNELKFTPYDEGREIEINFSESKIMSSNYNLKSLIVGFSQLRGYESFKDEDFISNKISQPHINDIIPLINNSHDKRFHSFIGWIVDLDLKSLQNEKNAQSVNKEKEIIEKVFDIITQITKHTIKFKIVKSASRKEIWVTTYDSPNGVPLNLLSQGFKIVMGWIGYYLERINESFPLSSLEQAINENAILMLDEIDTSIHPKWQAEFLKILRSTFPNTQFIFTTHSPLLIAGLNKEQIIEFEVGSDNEIKILENQIDTWVLNYSEILHMLFNTPEPTPIYTVEELNAKLNTIAIEKTSERNAIIDSINRLEANAKLKDSNTELKNLLNERQAELDKLIETYRKKISI